MQTDGLLLLLLLLLFTVFLIIILLVTRSGGVDRLLSGDSDITFSRIDEEGFSRRL